MANLSLPIGEVNHKLSFAHAISRGYRFRLDSDGNCCVLHPLGGAYHIHNFECDCPDKLCRGGSYSGHCKHEVWLAQLRPCDACSAVMALGEFKTCFGEILRRFECPSCGNARDFDLVLYERRAARRLMRDVA